MRNLDQTEMAQVAGGYSIAIQLALIAYEVSHEILEAMGIELS